MQYLGTFDEKAIRIPYLNHACIVYALQIESVIISDSFSNSESTLITYVKWTPVLRIRLKILSQLQVNNSEGGYGINRQVEKSKNMTIAKFMECDLNQLFWIFVDSWIW